MRTFGTVQEAMEFLIRRILEQGRREGVALSEVERKMMLVLIDAAGGGEFRPRGDILKFVLTALTIVFVLVTVILFTSRR